MKFLQKMKQKKADNKGFSLVELIIVIAIMAILVGIVGTQVVPYLSRSKESKDLQIVNSFSTAAMTAYASNADEVTATGTIEFDVYDTLTDATEILLADAIKELTYSDAELADLLDKFTSDACENVENIRITYNFDDNTISAQPVDDTDAVILEAVTSDM